MAGVAASTAMLVSNAREMHSHGHGVPPSRWSDHWSQGEEGFGGAHVGLRLVVWSPLTGFEAADTRIESAAGVVQLRAAAALWLRRPRRSKTARAPPTPTRETA